MSGIRSLEALQKFGSTSRVLNLNLVASLFEEDPTYHSAPMFKEPMLNRAILIKHRLRTDEVGLIPNKQPVATKIILPLDRKDLRIGGRSVLVNQIGYKQSLCNAIGRTSIDLEADFTTLELLSELPSLDPFLVRERLRRAHILPADCYFAISPADTAKMTNFAGVEISDLIRLAFGGGKQEVNPDLVKKLATALLSSNADEKLDPLRLTLGLEGEQFTQGIFSWKGFLYYKWQFSESAMNLRRVSIEMDNVKVLGKADRASKLQIEELKKSIRLRIRVAAKDCRAVLALYDDAFRDLCDKGNTSAFRKFLLDAPLLFVELGHAMGVISHIASYWGYRFQEGTDLTAEVSEYLDLLTEFDSGLAPERKTEVAW